MRRRRPFARSNKADHVFQLTATAQAALEAVSQFGPLLSAQILQLVWPKPSQETYGESVLRRLFDAGYLDRIPLVDGYGPPRVLNALGPLGRRIEAQRRQLSASNIGPRPAKQRSYKPLFINHHVATVQIGINLKLAVACLEGTLEKYTPDRELRRARNNSNARLAIIPDAFAVLNVATRTQSFFIELDRATKTVGSWRKRFFDYWRFGHTEAFHHDYNSPAILIVVDAPKSRAANRILGLKQVLNSNSGNLDPTMFWLTTLQDATPDAILCEPIWEVGGREGRFSLLPGGATAQQSMNSLPMRGVLV